MDNKTINTFINAYVGKIAEELIQSIDNIDTSDIDVRNNHSLMLKQEAQGLISVALGQLVHKKDKLPPEKLVMLKGIINATGPLH